MLWSYFFTKPRSSLSKKLIFLKYFQNHNIGPKRKKRLPTTKHHITYVQENALKLKGPSLGKLIQNRQQQQLNTTTLAPVTNRRCANQDCQIFL
jgi:hypothetical protein